MRSTLSQSARFALERWIQKGVLHQLLLMAALVALVAVAGGLLAWATTAKFAGAGEAVWWAFLRLTDPGYLGDDEGATLRVISTVVTVLGYVLFMGSLIAIMTQWLASSFRKLESGLTPIRMRDHVLVLGWTNRTPEIVLKLLSARGRLSRFLATRRANKLRVVVLSEEVGIEQRQQLREHLGPHWDESQVFLRSGSSLQHEHLLRLDLLRASTVIVPGADFALGGSETSDTRVIKTLLTISGLLPEGLERKPQVVAEVFDLLKLPLAESAIDDRIEVIPSDAVISRLISQSIRHPELAQALHGILSHREGNSIYMRNFPDLAGLRLRDLHGSFRRAIVLGFLRSQGDERSLQLDPWTEEGLHEDDLLVLLAPSFDDCAPEPGRPGAVHLERRAADPAGLRSSSVQRVIVLGWSHKIGALLHELGCSSLNRCELTVLSRVPAAEREAWLRRAVWDSERASIQHVEGDHSLESDLAAVQPETFDNVVLLASDWMPTSEEADARTILGYVLLRAHLERTEAAPEILVELLDPQNAHLFREGRDVQLVTPQLLSYLLAHVALRPELNTVFGALFGAGGYEITLTPVAAVGLDAQTTSFNAIQRATLEHGMIAVGVLTEETGIVLNPERGSTWTFARGDRLVVLAPEAGFSA